jgi:hypothetical protein
MSRYKVQGVSMKKGKNLLVTLTLMVALSLTTMPVFAVENENADSLEVTVTSEDGQKTSKTYDLSDLTSIDEDENGIMPLINVPTGTLKNGRTKTYSNSDGSAFYVAGSTVTFTVKLKSSAYVKMGYKNSSGTMTETYNGTSATNTTSISVPNTGRYRFYITNVSASTINITGGSITF